MIPLERRPMVMTDIPGFPLEKAQHLIENTPELKKVLLADKNRLVFILDRSTISLDLWNLFEDISHTTNLHWSFIPKDGEKGFVSRCQETIKLFSREPGFESSK